MNLRPPSTTTTVTLILAYFGAGGLMALALFGGPCASEVTWRSFAFVALAGVLPVAGVRRFGLPWWTGPMIFSILLFLGGLLSLTDRDLLRAANALVGPAVAFSGAWLRDLLAALDNKYP